MTHRKCNRSCPACGSRTHDGTCYECGMDITQVYLRPDGLLAGGPEPGSFEHWISNLELASRKEQEAG